MPYEWRVMVKLNERHTPSPYTNGITDDEQARQHAERCQRDYPNSQITIECRWTEEWEITKTVQNLKAESTLVPTSQPKFTVRGLFESSQIARDSDHAISFLPEAPSKAAEICSHRWGYSCEDYDETGHFCEEKMNHADEHVCSCGEVRLSAGVPV